MFWLFFLIFRPVRFVVGWAIFLFVLFLIYGALSGRY